MNASDILLINSALSSVLFSLQKAMEDGKVSEQEAIEIAQSVTHGSLMGVFRKKSEESKALIQEGLTLFTTGVAKMIEGAKKA